ncbi:zinc finger protein [Rhizoctonia solani]|uniref:Zinc finger protein n=1 Tax=Rhizoctonia solani TaxID=456999 RepID=A0A8H7I495_9AGAM|nr:zinc finger protein [Rhizoctonia solani]
MKVPSLPEDALESLYTKASHEIIAVHFRDQVERFLAFYFRIRKKLEVTSDKNDPAVEQLSNTHSEWTYPTHIHRAHSPMEALNTSTQDSENNDVEEEETVEEIVQLSQYTPKKGDRTFIPAYTPMQGPDVTTSLFTPGSQAQRDLEDFTNPSAASTSKTIVARNTLPVLPTVPEEPSRIFIEDPPKPIGPNTTGMGRKYNDLFGSTTKISNTGWGQSRMTLGNRASGLVDPSVAATPAQLTQPIALRADMDADNNLISVIPASSPEDSLDSPLRNRSRHKSSLSALPRQRSRYAQYESLTPWNYSTNVGGSSNTMVMNPNPTGIEFLTTHKPMSVPLTGGTNLNPPPLTNHPSMVPAPSGSGNPPPNPPNRGNGGNEGNGGGLPFNIPNNSPHQPMPNRSPPTGPPPPGEPGGSGGPGRPGGPGGPSSPNGPSGPGGPGGPGGNFPQAPQAPQGNNRITDVHFDYRIKIKDVLTSWDGNPDSLVEWVTSVDRLCERGPYIHAEIAKQLPFLFTKDALLWFNSMTTPTQHFLMQRWSDMKFALGRFFLTQQHLASLKNLIDFCYNFDDIATISEILKGAPLQWQTLIFLPEHLNDWENFINAIQQRSALLQDWNGYIDDKKDRSMGNFSSSYGRKDLKKALKALKAESKAKKIAKSHTVKTSTPRKSYKFPQNDRVISKVTPESKGARSCRHCGSPKHWDRDCTGPKSLNKKEAKTYFASITDEDEEYNSLAMQALADCSESSDSEEVSEESENSNDDSDSEDTDLDF